MLSFPVPGETEEIAWLWFALGISGQADTIRALTRKLQSGPSGSNWESELTEHACTNVAGGSGAGALSTPSPPQLGSYGGKPPRKDSRP